MHVYMRDPACSRAPGDYCDHPFGAAACVTMLLTLASLLTWQARYSVDVASD